ncbi:BamA/TamA family outer membrane protein [Leptolyngbya sp. CCY15150]|uniref:BamA/TamA family outer membrane protein n=1 Tax=Leptolyngbya sp. CCY15150 TaxID=2767772 RepID=UPI001950D9B3|nr:BamA/TamA family outer membrane protein [Leptolyngbya sp. CCY15150]
MQFSPVLLAVLTVSTTLGLATAATAAPESATLEANETQAHSSGASRTLFSPVGYGSDRLPAMPSPEAIVDENGVASPSIDDLEAIDLEAAEPAAIAQEPEFSAPAAIAQVGPGEDDDPDALEFEITPTPTLDLDLTPPSDTPTTPTPQPPAGDVGADDEETRVLVAEVVVVGAEGDLEDEVYQAISTQAGRTATRSQLQEDINAIFATGWFSNVRAVPSDTPLGVRVTYEVTPNPVLRSVQAPGTQVLPPEQLDEIFGDQYGTTLNLRRLDGGIRRLNEWYQAEGYILAQVVDAPDVSSDGVVTLDITEGVIEDVRVQFIDETGETVDEDGEPITGRTRDFIVTRELEAQPGDVFNQNQISQDLQRVFNLGIFDDVRLALAPGEDPRKVDVVVSLVEGNTGSLAAGLGFSGSTGIFGTVSYQQRNLGGNNQRLGAEVQVGERGFLFDVNFTDPWIGGDPYQTSYTVNAFNRRSISLVFDGGDPEVRLPDDENPNDIEAGDRPRIDRLGGGVSFTRPLDEWLGWDNWRGSLGLEVQRVSVRDSDGDINPFDALGNQLSFDEDGTDNLFILQLGLVNDQRNNPLQPTSGSVLRVGTEQSVPIGSGSILFNRLRASYSRYFPVNFTSFREDDSETLAFNVQVGTVFGDLPPYEAFSIGGTDSVRGYGSGEVGSGRSFLQATAEYRFPVLSIVGGALFVDFGTDLGTADNVPGQPANVRGKPGSGFGIGAGIRVQSPLGPIRIDYGVSDDGDGRFHFGIGERF